MIHVFLGGHPLAGSKDTVLVEGNHHKIGYNVGVSLERVSVA